MNWILFLYISVCCKVGASFILPITKTDGSLDVNSLRSLLTSLKQLVTRMHIDNKQRDADIASMKATIVTLETKLSQRNNQTDGIQLLKQEMSSSTTRITSMSQEIQSLKSDLNSMKLKDGQCQSLHNLTNDVNMNMQQVDVLMKETLTLKSNLTDLGACRTSLYTDMYNLSAGYRKLNDTMNSSQRSISDLNTTVHLLQLQDQLARDTLKNVTADISVGVYPASFIRYMSGKPEVTGSLKTDVEFEARFADLAINTSDYKALRFDTITGISRDAYNRTSGVFKVPVSGTYLFWAHVSKNNVRDSSSVDFNLYLELSGRYIGKSRAMGSGYVTASILTAVKATAQDELHVTSIGAGVIVGSFRTSFGGVLLHRD